MKLHSLSFILLKKGMFEIFSIFYNFGHYILNLDPDRALRKLDLDLTWIPGSGYWTHTALQAARCYSCAHAKRKKDRIRMWQNRIRLDKIVTFNISKYFIIKIGSELWGSVTLMTGWLVFSWTYDGFQLNLTVDDDTADLTNYVEVSVRSGLGFSRGWKLVPVNLNSNSKLTELDSFLNKSIYNKLCSGTLWSFFESSITRDKVDI